MPLPTEIYHLGRNLWFLNSLGVPAAYRYYGFGTQKDFLNGLSDNLKKLIEDSNGRYFCAVTNIYQKIIAKECLKKLNFKPIVSFYSAHNFSREILTFWLFVRPEKSKITEAKIDKFNEDSNCSISMMVGDKPIDRCKRFTISTEARSGFTRIMKMPIYYRILGEDDWGKTLDVHQNNE